MISLGNIYASNNIQIEQVLFNIMCVCVWVCGYAITTINEKRGHAIEKEQGRVGEHMGQMVWKEKKKGGK